MSGIGGIQSASDIQLDYMKLLVEQLKNQNPMEPMDNQQMSSQLAQFSSLQQLENLNASFGQILSSVKLGYGGSLVGKDVSFMIKDEKGEDQVTTGTVEGIFKDIEDEGKIKAVIGDYAVPVDDIMAINGQQD